MEHEKKVKKPKEVKAIKDTLINKLMSFEYSMTSWDEMIDKSSRFYDSLSLNRVNESIIDPSCKIGIEVEVENIKDYRKNYCLYWNVHEDNSLRNNGLEFVSYPLQGEHIIKALHLLFSTVLHPDREFSKRTSVHIHMNVRNMTPEQVTAYVCLFAVFEKLLYKFIGNDRDKNIFCVPLYETLITDNLLQGMNTGFKDVRWYKYSGLNLLPIRTQGSIELRQLYGTDSIPLIVSWINLLQRIRLYSITQPLDIILQEIAALNTNSEYNAFLIKVFQDQSDLLDVNSLATDMEDGVTSIKQCTLINNFHRGILDNVTTESPMITRLLDLYPVKKSSKDLKTFEQLVEEASLRIRTTLDSLPEVAEADRGIRVPIGTRTGRGVTLNFATTVTPPQAEILYDPTLYTPQYILDDVDTSRDEEPF